jgi:L-lactate dehydrogenase (cytochrome)
MRLTNCCNFHDFRRMAKQRLPGPIFNYIDGAAAGARQADRVRHSLQAQSRRHRHVLKALSLGAKAVGLGRYYLFPLAAAGQAGVERALELMRIEIERDMKLMGCSSVDKLTRENLRFR